MTTIQTNRPTAQSSASRAAQQFSKDAPKDWDVITSLNLNLAHLITLRACTKQAYWSAKGGNFYGLHKMFDDFSDELDAMADELAARIMILGGAPVWVPDAVAATSKLPSPSQRGVQAQDQLEQLAEAYREASRHLLPSMHKFIAIDNHVTAGILTSFAKLIDEQLSMIEAHGPATWAEKPPRRPLAS